MLRVLVVSDHDGLVAGLSELLTAVTDLELVGSCSPASLESNSRPAPDLVLADDTGNGNGARSIARTVQAYPAARVLLLTARPFHRDVRAALAAGAAGYVVKGGTPDDLLRAVRSHGAPADGQT